MPALQKAHDDAAAAVNASMRWQELQDLAAIRLTPREFVKGYKKVVKYEFVSLTILLRRQAE